MAVVDNTGTAGVGGNAGWLGTSLGSFGGVTVTFGVLLGAAIVWYFRKDIMRAL